MRREYQGRPPLARVHLRGDAGLLCAVIIQAIQDARHGNAEALEWLHYQEIPLGATLERATNGERTRTR